jgi:mannose-6-phosphate isomerase-like protein (cupin superfamily)
MFQDKSLPAEPTVLAPDGSEVRVLVAGARGSMAHFTLPPGQTSTAVRHRTVEELWYVLSGEGEMWREHDGRSEILALRPGVSLSIPLGTRFQFRCLGAAPLRCVGVTMPPWPGEQEAVPVPGPWQPVHPVSDAR